MPETPTYGFEYETPQSKPGITLTGDIDGSAPILAEQVDAALGGIDARLTAAEGDIAILQTASPSDSGWLSMSVTAATGYSLDSALYRRWGPIISVRVSFTRTGAAVTAGSTGNVTGDPLIGTINTAALRPDTIRREVVMLCSVTSGSGFVTTAGEIHLADLHSNSSLDTDDTIRYTDTYFTASFF